MAEAKKSAVKEIFEDTNAGRIDFLNAHTLAYSISGEMAKLEKLVEKWQSDAQTASAAARKRLQLAAGVGLWIMRRYEEAATALKPLGDHPEGAYFLALSLCRTGHYDKAEEYFDKAKQSGQDAFVCAMGIADTRRRAANIDGAMEVINKLQEDFGGEAELHYQKGRCLEATLDYETAMDAYERAVELNPQHNGALFRLAYWHDLRGNDELAIDYYEKAAQIAPVHENILLNLGNL